MKETNKIVISTAEGVDKFVSRLISSKAALLNGKLRTIVLSADSPSETTKLVSGLYSKNQTEAARQLARIARDYNEQDILGVLLFLRTNKNFEDLRKHLKEKHAPKKKGDEALRRDENDKNIRDG